MISYPRESREVDEALVRLHTVQSSCSPPADQIVEVFDAWGKQITNSHLASQPGVIFLSHWLRRNTLLSLLRREIGSAGTRGEWRDEGSIRLRRVPVGVVGHWPAANVAIQPLLSMSCAALGGNASAVRVPAGLEELTTQCLRLLQDIDTEGLVSHRLCALAFPWERRDLLEAMARQVDGAMIWGSAEAVLAVRNLPFPHWTRFSIFGPRNSVAMLDRMAWTIPGPRAQWCKRLARDVWQFEQRACSSPQVLYVERDPVIGIDELLEDLESAFREENRLHARTELAAAHASAIARARAEWLIDGESRQARFPPGPDWTILAGEGPNFPDPVQNRCLFVQVVDHLTDPLSLFQGQVQTIGLGCEDPAVERAIVAKALDHRVDRITWLGRMHVFDSPWNGAELVSPLTRLVRYTPINNEVAVA